MNFREYFEKFEKMQRWIITDLTNSTVYAKANFLVAMGIFNYIEILGSFYKHDRSNTQRFNFVFNNLLSSEYKTVFNSLQKLTHGAYDCLRCGMTHEYLVKTYNRNVTITFTIYGVDNEAGYQNNILSKNCGIELIKLGTNDYHLRIYNPRLIHDLNLAFEEYKRKLISNNRDYRKRFIQRCVDIRLETFN